MTIGDRMRTGRDGSSGRFLIVAVLTALSPAPGAAQAVSQAPWAGWAQCVVGTQGPGYSNQQTHTWSTTGGSPTLQGASRLHPATWSASGAGSLARTQGSQSLDARWTTSVPAMAGSISVVTRASDGRRLIRAGHAQLRQRGGVAGTQTQTVGSNPPQVTAISAEAFEWAFPTIEDAGASTRIQGSTTGPVAGSFGYMQPAGSSTNASCTWDFAQGVAPSPVPTVVTVAAGPGGGAAPGGAKPSPPPTTGPSTTTPTAPPAAAGGGAGAVAGGATTNPPAGSSTTPTGRVPTGSGAGQGQPLTTAPGSTTGITVGSGLPAGSPSAAPVSGTPQDPSNFSARQTGNGTVVLEWSAVPGAGSYLLGGPGAGVGMTVNGLSQTLTGIPQGTHTWTVATMYNPGGVMTTAAQWSRATATITNTSGLYRIVLAGFRVNRATFDERVNGNGDEVYAAVGVVTIDRRNASPIQPWFVVKSDPYGDVGRNPGYVRAGSFTPTGGLWAGDVAPAGIDPRMPPGATSATRLPLAIWQGTLSDGIEAVVVKPTLWEIDGQVDDYDRWATLRDASGNYNHPYRTSVNARDHAGQASAVKDRADRGDLTPVRGTEVVGCSEIATVADSCDGGFDRPIGFHKAGCIGLPANYTAWCDDAVVFTREGIERALSASSQVGGVPSGLVSIPLIEPPGVSSVTGGYDGSYDLYLRVERLP